MATRLRHCSDRIPGYTRQRAGHGWAYYRHDGERITDRDEIDRLNSIALPPAYTDAWYCPYANGHMLATGMDARGRKQYRYHPDFRAQQEADKYERCADFGRALPKLRARVEKDLTGRKLARNTVVAGRGPPARPRPYPRRERGLCQEQQELRRDHVAQPPCPHQGAELQIEYIGKSGKKQRLTIQDRRLARIVRQTQDLPGQHLFEYLDDQGTPHPVTSEDVNDYIRSATGTEFTAKHFRTWGATLLAFEHILDTANDGKLSLKPMLEAVAAALGNTPAISRKFLHPPRFDRALPRRGCERALLAPHAACDPLSQRPRTGLGGFP